MKSTGNGTPQNCTKNLLQISLGEVRFDILRGLDPAILDLPETIAMPQLQSSAYRLIATYEPRIEFNGAEVVSMMRQGDFNIESKGTVDNA